MNKYKIKFEFQTNDPPSVFIVDNESYQVLKVMEDPVPKTVEFSWDTSDWEPGLLSKKVVNLLNSAR
jgi:hypothetical protein